MAVSVKYTQLIITASCTTVFFLSPVARPAGTIPTAQDIDRCAEAATRSMQDFMQESFEPRLRYEFKGQFLTQHNRQNLRALAKTAGKQLKQIAQNQHELKQQIEDYDGNDWDSRYGKTGLWRKLDRDLYITRLSTCELDFYLALCAQQPQRNRILHTILDRANSLDQTRNIPYAHFLKAKALALLARTDPAYKLPAEKQFDLLTARSDMPQPLAFRTAMERIRPRGPGQPDELRRLTQAIAKSDHSDDIELVLSLAFLQRRCDPAAFENTVRKWPRIEDFLGSCILSELSRQVEEGRLEPQNFSVFEAELAARTAWKNMPQRHRMRLDYLASIERFQTPLILYVTAVAFADSSPPKAADLLLKAGRLQPQTRSHRFHLPASQIAKQAAQLAYNSAVKDRRHCPLALEAFENYSRIAGDKIDPDLEYLFSTMLQLCGRAEKSKKLLQKIACGPSGKWRNRARLDLITQAIQEKPQEKQHRRAELLKKLETLIADCKDKNEYRLRAKALAVYCPLLLEAEDKNSAQKVLAAITEADADSDPNLNVFKSISLRRLGRLNESVGCLLSAVPTDHCRHVPEAMELLWAVIDRVDELAGNDSTLMTNCKELSQICHDCLSSKEKQQAALLLVEISTFLTEESEKRLPYAEMLLDSAAENGLYDDVDFIRCRARLLTRHGKFDEAARLWRKIAQIRKTESAPPNQRGWKWWRAKYYELYCRAKHPQTDKASLSHTIEVIENSFRDIPPLWAQKLNSLIGEIK
ncbi:MAG: hypothetical protein ACYS76_07690 [Planctomycetota bacterium]